MARFGDLDTQYFDDAGDPLVNGKIYFYESGTTTPKATFADINQSIPNTNPVILTAAGRQPNIFFDGTAKAVLVSNSDVQILVRDPVGETATDFGDQWVATKIYNAIDVVLGSDGVYYRSLINGNQNNNPVTTSGFWTLLYSVEWNSGITYDIGAVVTYDNQQYQSLQTANLNKNPASQTSWWVPLNFAWVATATYSEDQNVVGTDGILYTSLQNSNTGNDPATSPAYWVGTSAAAAASAVAAAASAAAALVSENAAAADAIATAADRVQTGLDAAATSADAIATAADRVQTGLDAAATAADVILTNADAVATAADRVQTGLDAAATSADAVATAADRVQTGLDVITTNADAASTAADAVATAADRVQTGLDATATAADRVQTGLDATAAAGSASAASASATAAAGSATDASDKYDEFDARYLGEKASDPSVDNQGGALVEGALYFNTTSDAMKVYDGAAWVSVAPVATSVTVSQISDYTGTATTLNYTSNLTSDAQTQLDTKAVYPSQTGNAGEYLTTDGTNTSWAPVESLPDQTGNSGLYLTTNGTDASWDSVSAINVQCFGTSATWTKPTGANLIYAEIWGAGAGGQSGRTCSNLTDPDAQGGGGGAYKFGYFQASELGATESVTVGAGGNGGCCAASHAKGTCGGNSCFKNIVAWGGDAFDGKGGGYTRYGGTIDESYGFCQSYCVRNDRAGYPSLGGGRLLHRSSGNISNCCLSEMATSSVWGGGAGGNTICHFGPTWCCRTADGGNSYYGGGGGGAGGRATNNSSDNYTKGGIGGGAISDTASTSQYYLNEVGGVTTYSYRACGCCAAVPCCASNREGINGCNGGFREGGGGGAAQNCNQPNTYAGHGGNGGCAGGGGGGGMAGNFNSGCGGNGGNGFVRIYTW